MPARETNHHSPDQALAVLDPLASAASAASADGYASGPSPMTDDEFAQSIRQPDAIAGAAPGETAPEVKYATAASYKKGVEIPLCNGEWVQLRPRSLLTMVRTGKLPNSLVGAARRMLMNQGRQQNPNAPQDPKVAAESLELQDYLITQLVSSMKIVMADPDECDDDEVSVADVFEGDKNRIVAFAMQGQKALEDFRQK